MSQLARLTERLSRLPSESPLRALMSTQIEALEGRSTEAALSGFYDENAGGLLGAYDDFVEFFVTLCVSGHRALAATLLKSRFDLPCDLRFSSKPMTGRPIRPDYVLWQRGGETSHEFAFHHSLESLRSVDQLLRAFVREFPLIARYIRAQACEKGEVFWSIGDDTVAPGLGYSSEADSAYLIPDHYFVASHGHASQKQALDRKRATVKDVKDVAFWRGATTGRTGKHLRDWRDLPRTHLCRFANSREALEHFDVKYSVVTGDLSEPLATIRQAMHAEGIIGEHVPLADMLNYKTQIDIDGNTNSWPGLFTKLYSGCPVLKVASRQGLRQWYYGRLIPWHNYVPVSSDLSDMLDKVVWLKKNPSQAEEIGRNGRAVAESMTYEREVGAAMDTIRQAFRHFRGDPDVSFGFDTGGLTGRNLVHGWANAEVSTASAQSSAWAWAVGHESCVELVPPDSGVPYTASLEVRPHPTVDLSRQSVTVIANGHVLGEFRLDAKAELRFEIPAFAMKRGPKLRLTLLNDFASHVWRPGGGKDHRDLAFRLLRISLRRAENMPRAP